MPGPDDTASRIGAHAPDSDFDATRNRILRLSGLARVRVNTFLAVGALFVVLTVALNIEFVSPWERDLWGPESRRDLGFPEGLPHEVQILREFTDSNVDCTALATVPSQCSQQQDSVPLTSKEFDVVHFLRAQVATGNREPVKVARELSALKGNWLDMQVHEKCMLATMIRFTRDNQIDASLGVAQRMTVPYAAKSSCFNADIVDAENRPKEIALMATVGLVVAALAIAALLLRQKVIALRNAFSGLLNRPDAPSPAGGFGRRQKTPYSA